MERLYGLNDGTGVIPSVLKRLDIMEQDIKNIKEWFSSSLYFDEIEEKNNQPDDFDTQQQAEEEISFWCDGCIVPKAILVRNANTINLLTSMML